jgi:hypothetical protein
MIYVEKKARFGVHFTKGFFVFLREYKDIENILLYYKNG